MTRPQGLPAITPESTLAKAEEALKSHSSVKAKLEYLLFCAPTAIFSTFSCLLTLLGCIMGPV